MFDKDAPITSDQILGRVTGVERGGRSVGMSRPRTRLPWALLCEGRARAHRGARWLASRSPLARLTLVIAITFGLALAPGSAEAQTAYLVDDFTGVDLTPLSSHDPSPTGDPGSWGDLTPASQVQLFGNQLRAGDPNDLNLAYNNIVPTSADTAVGFDVTFPTQGGANNWFVLGGRYVAGAYYYVEVRGNGNVELHKVSGGDTVLTTCPDGTFSGGDTVRITLSFSGSDITSSVGGVECNFTDTVNPLTDPGGLVVGIRSNNQELLVDGLYGSTLAPTAARIASASATRTATGVAIEWHSGYELDNLGYHVYREQDGKRVRLTSSLIGGSVLFAGAGTALTAGRSYAWQDTGKSEGAYWIEAVDLDGARTWFGPVNAAPAAPSRPRMAASTSPLGLHGPAQGAILQRSYPAASSAAAPRPRSAQLTAPELQHAIELGISERGWYRVEQADLVAAGFAPDAPAAFIQVWSEGGQVPIRVIGGDDGTLDAGDAIELYGVGLDTQWTDTRAYWVGVGIWAGKRLAVDTAASGGELAQSFRNTVERHDRLIYVAAANNGSADNFFGQVVAATPVSEILELQHLAGVNGVAQLEIALRGLTSDDEIAPDHQVRIWLGENQVGLMTWDGKARHEAAFEVPAAWLAEGENAVRLQAEAGDMDINVVDWVRLTHSRAYSADENALSFSVPAGGSARVTGFTTPDIRVLDVTNPDIPISVDVDAEAAGQGAYAVTVRSGQPGERLYWASAEAAVLEPAVIGARRVSIKTEAVAAAGLVIISHPDFIDAVQPLAAARTAQGWSVAVVSIEDIYDGFGYGNKHPNALRGFFQWKYSEQPMALGHVLLVGDASFDPRDYLGFGDLDFVPTASVNTEYLETASDGTLADVDGDGVPEFAMGRLPVRTSEQAASLVAKLLAYQPADASWARDLLFVSDENDEHNFEAMSDRVYATVPDGFESDVLPLGGLAIENARTELLAQLNAGHFLVHYAGHGSTENWKGLGLLTTADVASLENGAQQPIYLNMTCLNGFFHDLYTHSLAETLLLAEGRGAIAVWASSGLTYPAQQTVAAETFVGTLLRGEASTLGEAALAAKTAAASDLDVVRTWVLLGDPTMPSPFVPEPPDPPVVDPPAVDNGGCGVTGRGETGAWWLLLLALGTALLRRRARV